MEPGWMRGVDEGEAREGELKAGRMGVAMERDGREELKEGRMAVAMEG